MKRILSGNAMEKEIFHHDAHTNESFIEQVQNVDAVLKENEIARNSHGSHKSEIFNHKARIPVSVAKRWCKQRGIKYGQFLAQPELLKKFLNDSDNKPWLKIPGKV